MEMVGGKNKNKKTKKKQKKEKLEESFEGAAKSDKVGSTLPRIDENGRIAMNICQRVRNWLVPAPLGRAGLLNERTSEAF